jgi:AcrR family transcriptional regulator
MRASMRSVSARPRPRRRFRDADESRARILSAAVAEFAAGGYRGASLGAIAARAGISQSGLLHHFPSKELLLAAVVDARTAEHREAYLAAKADDPNFGFMTAMVQLMRLGARDRDLTRLFTVVVAEASSPDHPAHEWAAARYANTTATVVEALKDAQQRELLRPDFDPHVVAVTLLSTMDGLQLRDALTPYAVRIDQAFAQIAGQVLEDLAFDSPRAAAAVTAWRHRHDPSGP